MAAGVAHIVREVKLAAVAAFLKLTRFERMVAAPHIAAGGRCFSLWNGHTAPLAFENICLAPGRWHGQPLRSQPGSN